MGFLFGSGTKAARIQADATLKSAELSAGQDRLAAQAAQTTRETMIAQSRASAKAAELLSRPQEKVEVQLGPDTATPTIDPQTGRRRTTRSAYSYKRESGINIS